MPSERRIQSSIIYRAIAKLLEKLTGQYEWMEAPESIYPVTDALASSLCILARVAGSTKEEMLEGIKDLWETQDEDDETMNTIDSISYDPKGVGNN